MLLLTARYISTSVIFFSFSHSFCCNTVANKDNDNKTHFNVDSIYKPLDETVTDVTNCQYLQENCSNHAMSYTNNYVTRIFIAKNDISKKARITTNEFSTAARALS